MKYTRESLALILALQQSMMLTQYQSTLMSSRSSKKASDSTAEEHLEKRPEQKQETITVSKDKIMEDLENSTTSKKKPFQKKPEANIQVHIFINKNKNLFKQGCYKNINFFIS